MPEVNYSECEEVVDQVVEYLGMKMRKSHIKIKLRELLGEEIAINTIEHLISTARKRIVELYQVDVSEFKGSAIEFYSSVIRKDDVPLKYKLVAQQRLDILLGLEHTSLEDPQTYAQRVLDAMKEMNDTVPDKPMD